MSERDLVAVGMDALVPLRLERAPAWDDVLARAGLRPTVTSVPACCAAATSRQAPRTRSRDRCRDARRSRRLLRRLSATMCSEGSARGSAEPRASPRRRRSRTHSHNGTARRTRRSRLTRRLRLLDTQRVRGKSFTLLGFRDGGSLCLRLVPTDAPALGGVNQCVTLRELRRSPVPAVVASTAYYPIAGGRVAAVFGFADDTVHSVRVTHATGGAQTVRAVNNVFLALHAGPSDPIYDPVVQVTARLRTGASIVLPFTTLGALVQSQVPSYLRYEAVRLPGPTRQEATLPRVEIGWLDRRERRGGPFVPSLKAYGPKSRQVVFARSVQPDPDDAYRIGLAVIRVRTVSPPFDFTWVKRSADARPHRVRLRPGMLLLCSDELFPLRPAPIFNNCVLHARSSGLFPAGHVLTVNRMYREAFTRVSGLAADGVSEIDLYLASGRVIPAGLRDNAYTVEAPSAQWPAKLVAFDRHGRPLGVYPIDSQKSRAVIAPCPPAVLTGSTRRRDAAVRASGPDDRNRRRARRPGSQCRFDRERARQAERVPRAGPPLRPGLERERGADDSSRPERARREGSLARGDGRPGHRQAHRTRPRDATDRAPATDRRRVPGPASMRPPTAPSPHSSAVPARSGVGADRSRSRSDWIRAAPRAPSFGSPIHVPQAGRPRHRRRATRSRSPKEQSGRGSASLSPDPTVSCGWPTSRPRRRCRSHRSGRPTAPSSSQSTIGASSSCPPRVRPRFASPASRPGTRTSRGRPTAGASHSTTTTCCSS